MSIERKVNTWIEDNVTENIEDIKIIGNIAHQRISDDLNIYMSREGENDHYSMPISVYGVIFESICDAIKDQRSSHNKFEVSIADRLIIGYSSTSDEDDEKSGNFMVYLKHKDKTIVEGGVDDNEIDPITLATRWNAANVNEHSELLKTISKNSKESISNDLDIILASSEQIIPIFCIIHESIVSYCKIKFAEMEKNSFELNIAGLYIIGIEIEDDTDDEVIYFEPSISLKLKFKDDTIANRNE